MAWRALAEQTARLDSIELVVCSPLTCSLETATAGFADYVARGSPVVALEAVRELASSKADARRPRSELTAQFSHVSFDHVQGEVDDLWEALAANEGNLVIETVDAIEARCSAALEWILARPEKELAVVSHPAFLHHLTNVGYEPLTQAPIEEGLEPRLRTPRQPPPAFVEDVERLSSGRRLVKYPSPHLARTLRPPFEPCEVRIVAAVPL